MPGRSRDIAQRAALVFALTAAGSLRAQPAAGPLVLGADELTSIRSVVGNGALMWAPDVSHIAFAGAYGAGSDIWAVRPTGGFPLSLDVQMGPISALQNHQPASSPNGQWISYISNRTGAAELFVHSMSDGREVQLTNLGAHINSYTWSPDGQRIAFADDRYGNFDIFTVTVPGGVVRRITSDILFEVYPTWTPDSRRIVYVELDDRWANHNVRIIDADGRGASRLITQDTAFFDYSAGGTFGYPLVSPDGARVLFRSPRSGWINYWTVPIGGGAPRQLAAESADQSGARWSPDGKSILYLAMSNGTQDLRVVDADGGAPRVAAKPADMGVIANAAWSPDGSRIAYTLATPVTPADLFMAPADGGIPVRLTNSVGPSYLETALVRPRKVSYPSADGLTVHGYLYGPVLKPGEKAPGIMLIHGGPTGQFADTYQEQAQFLAMHGYAVLLPNIRGSSGYSLAFEDANKGCWGRCDLKDVLAGVAFLRQQAYVDSARMGITGTSYGGIMSLAASAFAPGVFQAAIPQSGYGDWPHVYEEQELRHIKYILYELGPMPQSLELYRSLSSIYYIDSIQTPIFLIHGAGRPGLPRADDSQLFADRLEMRYKPYKYKTYPNENYYVQNPANVREMLGDMLAFFDRYLKDNHGQPAP